MPQGYWRKLVIRILNLWDKNYNFTAYFIIFSSNPFMKYWIPIVLFLSSLLCPFTANANRADTTLYHEPYRPQYHFTPAHRWIGDPCGLVRKDGKYMAYSWGAYESDDLIHWKELNDHSIKGMPPKTAAFTGSVAVDTTGGFAAGNTMAAVFTLFEEDTKKQCQAVAFSHDGGVTFEYCDRNPVIDIWSTEFRDPTVIRYEPTGKWVMAVAKALEKKVSFYQSDNLIDWEWTSDFGPMGDNERSWECPDLFQVTVEETGERKWVLLVSVNWAREQYFVGDFDGKVFTPDKPYSLPLYVDDGLDYYASRVFVDYDNADSDPVTLGWVNYWDYAPTAPSKWGKGIWSIPRTYTLAKDGDGELRLRQTPVSAVEDLRGKPTKIKRTFGAGTFALPQITAMSNCYEMEAVLELPSDGVAGFNLCVGDGRKVSLTYDAGDGSLHVNRMNCSDIKIPKFDRTATSVIGHPGQTRVSLRIFVDKSTIEIFADNGLKVLTLLTYAAPDQTGVEFFSQKGKTGVDITARPMNPVR